MGKGDQGMICIGFEKTGPLKEIDLFINSDRAGHWSVWLSTGLR